MNTRLLLAASAVVMGGAGLAATFAPDELLARAASAPSPALTLLVQAVGALLFAFAMVNWTARGSLIGGIYNKPVALGNLTHFAIVALAALKAVARGSSGLWPIALVYAVFALAFAMVFFRTPVRHEAAVDASYD